VIVALTVRASAATAKAERPRRTLLRVTEQAAASVLPQGDTVVVALRGEVDVLNVEQVRVAVHEAIAARPREILVDLAALSFIDSTGLGALIFGFQRARDARIAFRLAHPTRLVRQVLVLSGLLEVVQLVDQEPGAETEAAAG
jgi:anti-anti-sigma factor